MAAAAAVLKNDTRACYLVEICTEPNACLKRKRLASAGQLNPLGNGLRGGNSRPWLFFLYPFDNL